MHNLCNHLNYQSQLKFVNLIFIDTLLFSSCSFRNKQLKILNHHLNFLISPLNYHQQNLLQLYLKMQIFLYHHLMMMLHLVHRKSSHQSIYPLHQLNHLKAKLFRPKPTSKRNHLHLHFVHVLAVNRMHNKIKQKPSLHPKKKRKKPLHQKKNRNQLLHPQLIYLKLICLFQNQISLRH